MGILLRHFHVSDHRVPVFYLMLAVGLSVAPTSASNASSTAADRAVTTGALADTHLPGAEVPVFDAAAWSPAATGGIDQNVLSVALRAAAKAVERGEATAKTTLTVIDFSRPSTTERLWTFDLAARTLLFKEAVSHGRNSGHNMATKFSNVAESNMSSLGLFRAAEGYFGKHGYSLRLDGLEKGINDRARARAIVIHGADYVNLAVAKTQGRLGRSLGCPAVRREVSAKLIDAIKEGGLVFAYYPDTTLLETSEYLN
jgi:hypothetical protein